MPLPARKRDFQLMSKMDDLLAVITRMPQQELRDEWEKLYGSEAPTAMSKELMRLAISYRRQELEFGGLSRRTSRQLRILSKVGKAEVETSSPRHLKPGAKLLREWHGKVHEIQALEDSHFAYAGKVWRSLSEIAREITGVRWSGPRFFGIKGRKRTGPNG